MDIENVPRYKILLGKRGQIGYVTKAVNKPLMTYTAHFLHNECLHDSSSILLSEESYCQVRPCCVVSTAAIR